MVQVLLNPTAGKGRALQNKTELEALLRQNNISYELHLSQSEEHMRNLVRKCGRDGVIVVGVGGDSTLAILVNEIVSQKLNCKLAMIGQGSQDDIVRSYGFANMTDAIKAIAKKESRPIDLGMIKKDKELLTLFSGQSNIGLGAFVNRYVFSKTQRYRFARHWLTFWGLLGSWRAFKGGFVPQSLNVRSDTESLQGAYHVALFSKIRFWAGGKLFVPDAKIDDGLLHLVLINSCTFLNLLRIYDLATSGRHLQRAEVKYLTSKSFSISSERAFMVQVDGEIIKDSKGSEKFEQIEIATLPKAIEMIC